MQAAIVFIIVSAVILLIPLCLVLLVVKLTSLRAPKRPKEYYASYALLIVAAMYCLALAFHLLGQILSGTIYFKPRNASHAWLFTLESQPVQFISMSALYIAFSVLALGVLLKSHRLVRVQFSGTP